MPMTSWTDLIYEDWRKACGKTSSFISQNYHRVLPSGKHVLKDGKGQANLQLSRDTFCLEYQNIRNQLNSCQTLLKRDLQRRCDYMLCDDVTTLLVEITSGKSAATLEHLKDEKSQLTKFEKVELQLLQTLQTLCLADSVKTGIYNCPYRVALCAYTIASTEHTAQRAFSRPLSSQPNGAAFPSPQLNAEGFEYRRIMSTATFTLP